MKILCTICARKNSKGLKNKNLLKIRGKQLILYTIQQSRKIKLFSDIVVSTDSQKIINLVKHYSKLHIIERSKNLSGDKVGKIKVIRDALDKIEKKTGNKYNIICDLDVTSPLRSINDINRALKKFKKEKLITLLSANKSYKNPYFNIIEKKGKKVFLSKNLKKFQRRQDAPTTYDLNASIYIFDREYLIKSDNIISKKSNIFVMPRERSIDIDNELDLKIVKTLMRRKDVSN